MFTGFAQVLLRFCSTFELGHRKDDFEPTESQPRAEPWRTVGRTWDKTWTTRGQPWGW